MSCIYALTSAVEPDRGVRYIGSSVETGPERLRGHLRLAGQGGTAPVSAWIRAVGPENVVVTEIDWYYGDDRQELRRLEARWIRYTRRTGRVLLNVNLPQRIYEDRSRPPVALRAPAQLPAGVIL